MYQKQSIFAVITLMVLMNICLWAGPSRAQEEQQGGRLAAAPPAAVVSLEPGNDRQEKGITLFQLIKKGGIVGYVIILLSCLAVGFIIDYAVTIRMSKLAPQRDIAVFRKLIRDKKIEEITKLDQLKTSFLSQVVIAGLKESNLGYATMIKAMEDAAEALSARIARKIEHLNVIGNIAPMMGLLGTVIGMLRCFNEISHITGAIEPKQLAGGIFEALVTTCMGLVVAIPALYFYSIFRNRVDECTGRAALVAEELVSSFKLETEDE